jgi:hypothetical protein
LLNRSCGVVAGRIIGIVRVESKSRFASIIACLVVSGIVLTSCILCDDWVRPQITWRFQGSGGDPMSHGRFGGTVEHRCGGMHFVRKPKQPHGQAPHHDEVVEERTRHHVVQLWCGGGGWSSSLNLCKKWWWGEGGEGGWEGGHMGERDKEKYGENSD